MNFLFSGEESKFKNFLSPQSQKYIATAINIAPLALSVVSGLFASLVVKMFRLSDVTTGSSDLDTGTDTAISFLLGLLFSVELGTRLFSIVSFQQQLHLTSYLMPKANRDFIYQITDYYNVKNIETFYFAKKIKPEDKEVQIDIDFKEPNYLAFLSALYSTAGLNTLKNEAHLRWILFDLTLFYHIFIRAYAISGDHLTDMGVFTTVVAKSYMHFFTIMMMFSTTESIRQYYRVEKISDKLQVPAHNAYVCLKIAMNYMESDDFIKDGKTIASSNFKGNRYIRK